MPRAGNGFVRNLLIDHWRAQHCQSKCPSKMHCWYTPRTLLPWVFETSQSTYSRHTALPEWKLPDNGFSAVQRFLRSWCLWHHWVQVRAGAKTPKWARWLGPVHASYKRQGTVSDFHTISMLCISVLEMIYSSNVILPQVYEQWGLFQLVIRLCDTMLCLSYARIQSHSGYHSWCFQVLAALSHHPWVDNRANSLELQGVQARSFVPATIKHGIYLYARSSKLH
jgi:hypothetical protein